MHQVLVDRTNSDGSRSGFVAGESFVPDIALRLARRIRDKGKKKSLNQTITLLDERGKAITF